MKATKKRQNFFAITMMALLLALATPATGLGQGRWRSRNNGNWSNRNWTRHNNKKYGKFVNGHDARDGRWDNRGARGDRVGNMALRNRIRERNRSFNNNNADWRNVRRNQNPNVNNNDWYRRGLVNRNRDLNDGRDSSGNRRGKHRDN